MSNTKQTLSRKLRAICYRKLSARPRHHAKTYGSIEHFKKLCSPAWMKLRNGKASRAVT